VSYKRQKPNSTWLKLEAKGGDLLPGALGSPHAGLAPSPGAQALKRSPQHLSLQLCLPAGVLCLPSSGGFSCQASEPPASCYLQKTTFPPHGCRPSPRVHSHWPILSHMPILQPITRLEGLTDADWTMLELEAGSVGLSEEEESG
jgi:hypothetical protein